MLQGGQPHKMPIANIIIHQNNFISHFLLRVKALIAHNSTLACMDKG